MSKSAEDSLGIWLDAGVLGVVGLLLLTWTAFSRQKHLVGVPVIAAVIAYTFYMAAAFFAGAELPKFLRDHLFDGLAPAAAVGFLVNSMSLHNPRTAFRWIRRPVMILVVLSAGAALIFGAIGALAVFSSGSDDYGKPVELSALFGAITFFTWYFVIALPYSYSETLWAWVRWWFSKRAEPAGHDQENG